MTVHSVQPPACSTQMPRNAPEIILLVVNATNLTDLPLRSSHANGRLRRMSRRNSEHIVQSSCSKTAFCDHVFVSLVMFTDSSSFAELSPPISPPTCPKNKTTKQKQYDSLMQTSDDTFFTND